MIKQRKIPTIIIGFMIFVALMFDLVSLLPFANVIIVPCATLTFWYWFRSYGIRFNRRIIATAAVAAIIELIPFLSMLPAWTLAVIITIVLSKAPAITSKITGTSTKQSDRVQTT